MKQIVVTPNPVLVNRSSEVEKFDKHLLQTIEEMTETLKATTDPKGVGLAAPQVGIPIRLFLVKPTDNSKTYAFINPEIVEIVEGEGKKSRRSILEGCLSIPTIWGKVTRNKSIKLHYKDEHGKSHTRTFKGFMATIIQHELDHLNGILFTKHVMEQGEKLYKSHKNEKGEDEFDEIRV